jgi:hypothetical protein
MTSVGSFDPSVGTPILFPIFFLFGLSFLPVSFFALLYPGWLKKNAAAPFPGQNPELPGFFGVGAY